MRAPDDWVVVGIDNGGTANNATVLDSGGRFLVDDLAETASYVKEGPDKAIAALLESFTSVLALTSVPTDSVKAIGLDTPGPASADGVISSLGATNFVHPGWRGFDIRGALQDRVGIPVVYNNDGNSAALYAHHVNFGAEAPQRSTSRSRWKASWPMISRSPAATADCTPTRSRWPRSPASRRTCCPTG
jgi:predicted NBD/HSP70 family sugar kinase